MRLTTAHESVVYGFPGMAAERKPVVAVAAPSHGVQPWRKMRPTGKPVAATTLCSDTLRICPLNNPSHTPVCRVAALLAPVGPGELDIRKDES